MTEKYWKRKVNEWKTTQVSMAEYCRQKNLSYWSFRIWKNRLESDSIHSESKPFVKIGIPGAMKIDLTSSLEIHLGKLWIKVPDNFNENNLQRILTILQKTDLQ